MVGVFLLLMTLGMAWTGEVMRFDQDAFLGLHRSVDRRPRATHRRPIGRSHDGWSNHRWPYPLRFFDLHVFVIPGTLLVLVAVHVWMVLKLDINDWPMPGRPVRRSTYMAEYHKLSRENGFPFVPGAFWKDLIFSGAVLAAVAVCAPSSAPTVRPERPIPRSFNHPQARLLLSLDHAVLAYLPPSLQTPFILKMPILGIAVLLALPFYAGEGERAGTGGLLRC